MVDIQCPCGQEISSDIYTGDTLLCWRCGRTLRLEDPSDQQLKDGAITKDEWRQKQGLPPLGSSLRVGRLFTTLFVVCVAFAFVAMRLIVTHNEAQTLALQKRDAEKMLELDHAAQALLKSQPLAGDQEEQTRWHLKWRKALQALQEQEHHIHVKWKMDADELLYHYHRRYPWKHK